MDFADLIDIGEPSLAKLVADAILLIVFLSLVQRANLEESCVFA